MIYFLVSDIHSFYDELINSLKKAGYDQNNPNHCLVVLGDIFDRGRQSKQIYNFLKNIPLTNRILIRGNHELLFKELIEGREPEYYDYTNGTLNTFFDLAEEIIPDWIKYYLITKQTKFYIEYSSEYKLKMHQEFKKVWKRVLNKVKKLEIDKWFDSNEWVDFAEIGDYICVHCFIPFQLKDEVRYYYKRTLGKIPKYYFNVEPFNLLPIKNWRTKATENAWDNAKWGNPYNLFRKGLFNEEIKNNKTLVCGHFSSCIYHKQENKVIDYGIFIRPNFVCIDAQTVTSHQVNVFKIELE